MLCQPGTTTYYQYDGDGHVLTTTTPKGNQTVEGYDHIGRQISTNAPPVTLCTGQMTQPVATTGYDGEDHVVTQTDGAGT